MAVGDGGFSTKPMGFDKNEVNEYISNLRKRMQEIEAEKKENDEKTEAALKQAEAADERVKAAEQAGEEKVAQLQLELNAAQHGADNLNAQIESLKIQLEAEKKKMSDMLRSGKGIDSEAKRAYAEVIEKAEADAKDIISNAEDKASDIINTANQEAQQTKEKTNELLNTLRTQIEAISGSYKAISQCAGEIFAISSEELDVAVPEIALKQTSHVKQPEQTASAVQNEKAESAEETVQPKEIEPTAEQLKEEPAAAQETAPEEATESALSSSEMEVAKPDESGLASFDEDVWGGSAMAAQSIYDEAKERQGIPLLNPDRDESLKMFGAHEEEQSEETIELPEADEEPAEETIDEVKPMDNDEHAKAAFDNDFANDLLAQTMTSANLGEDADDDLLAAIKAQEEKFAVKPRETVGDLDMGDGVSDDEFDFMKTLENAEKKLHSLGGGNAEFEVEQPKMADLGASSPWDDMQKELDALEKSGAFNSSEEEFDQPEPETPAAPSADDSSIWNFGTDSTAESTSDDDMMSSDFGGFGL